MDRHASSDESLIFNFPTMFTGTVLIGVLVIPSSDEMSMTKE